MNGVNVNPAGDEWKRPTANLQIQEQLNEEILTPVRHRFVSFIVSQLDDTSNSI